MDKVKTCDHPKDRGCLWCLACGAKIAGRKPGFTVKAGWHVLVDDGHGPGSVLEVRMVVLGLGTKTPCWHEEVTVRTLSGLWTGPASHLRRLVVEDRHDG